MTQEQPDDAVRCAGFAMVRTPFVQDAGTPGCYFGGRPHLPVDMDWPMLALKGHDIEVPMHYISRIDLAELPDYEGLPAFPKRGSLLLFLELTVGVGSFVSEPYEYTANGAAARIIYLDDAEVETTERVMPPAPDLDRIPSVKQMRSILTQNRAADSFAFHEFNQWPFAVVPRDYLASPDPHWVENDPRFANRATFDEIKEANDAFHARIKTMWPSFDYHDRWRRRLGLGHHFLGAPQSTSIPNKKFVEELRYIGCDPITENDIVLMVVSDIPEIGMKISSGGPPYQIFIDKDDLAKGNFGRLRIWRATD